MNKDDQKGQKDERPKRKPALKPEANSPKERIKSQEPGVKKSEPGINPNSASGTEPTPTTDRHTLPELQTENSQLQTEKMEVHHHPQLDHKPKPWKEYLLEGFMIFIAVMMGFIAENIREDITNNQHAHQLISQLVQDLKTDTARLNKIYSEETQIVKRNDTLFDLLQQPVEKMDAKRILQLVNKGLD